MKKQKIFSFVSTFILLLSLAACANTPGITASTATPLPPNPFEQTDNPSSGSDNSSGGLGGFVIEPVGFDARTDTFTYDGQPNSDVL